VGDLLGRLSSQKEIRISVWNSTPAMISSGLAVFEAELNKIYATKITILKSLHDGNIPATDLLICYASFIDEDIFEGWLQGLELRIPVQNSIKIPSIIMSNVGVDIHRRIMNWSLSVNWYFDIINQSDFSSLTMRATNLLRFHDHLHELVRMENALNKVSIEMQALEERVSKQLLK